MAEARNPKPMPTKPQTSQIVSRKRVADHGEVFTAEREVKAMCDLVKSETERIESRFLEPACGQGAFLVEILRRKLSIVTARYRKAQNEWERYAMLAVSSLYGIDILADNVALCRENLNEIFRKEYTSLFPKSTKEECFRSVNYILSLNILWGDALTLELPDNSKKPIVFAEWSDTGNGMFKRRDYTMANLLQSQPIDGPNLFSDLGEQAFIPTPVADYPITHFLKLGENETAKL